MPFVLTAGGVLMGASVMLSVAFFFYGLNVLYLIKRSGEYREPRKGRLAQRPAVAVHLPIYNELYVVARLLRACARMADSYGKDLVSICVIDDSDDETVQEVDRLSLELAASGYRVTVIRRGTRAGYKAGALQAALERTKEEYIAIFDADFVPPPDFIESTLPYVVEDKKVGFVQCRWAHIDRSYNPITSSLAIGVDAHFIVEQRGRSGGGYMINFNGSAGLLRRRAILDAGGWDPDTLAEDLDLSYRMQLIGYRGIYLNGVEVPGELPPTVVGLKRQQGRWARGSLQTAKKLLGRIAHAKRLTLGQKFEAAAHLTYYLVHPLMVASFMLALIATFMNVDVISYSVKAGFPTISFLSKQTALGIVFVSIEVAPWVIFSVLVAASTVAVLLYCVVAMRAQGQGVLRNAWQLLFLVLLGYGISISNSVQALAGIFSRSVGTFHRTPKYAVVSRSETWRGKKYQIPLGGVALLESSAVAAALAATIYALKTGNFGIMPILLVYLAGYTCVLSLTLHQAIGVRGRAEARLSEAAGLAFDDPVDVTGYPRYEQ
jgi:cellulose synthase/poly-beta-1,6-N-acetylglucosamine synthase-like glycosyltransferase